MWLQTTGAPNGTKRDYTITFSDDPPQRAEAVKFFMSRAPHERNAYTRLFPDVEIPSELASMTLHAAQAYLDSHPLHQQWRALHIQQSDPVFDGDLARLQHLPEIKCVQIISSRITNKGVRHLQHLGAVERLVLSSRKVTNACLSDIVQLKTLRMLDLQLCPFVSRSAFFNATKQLPLLVDAFSPLRWPLTAIFRWFYTEWRIQRRTRS